MANVGEKRRLRSIYLRQCFGALPLLLISPGVGHLTSDGGGQQIKEGTIGFIQCQSWTDTGYKRTNWALTAGWRNRQSQSLFHRLGIFTTGELPESRLQVIDKLLMAVACHLS